LPRGTSSRRQNIPASSSPPPPPASPPPPSRRAGARFAAWAACLGCRACDCRGSSSTLRARRRETTVGDPEPRFFFGGGESPPISKAWFYYGVAAGGGGSESLPFASPRALWSWVTKNSRLLPTRTCTCRHVPAYTHHYLPFPSSLPTYLPNHLTWYLPTK